VSGVKLTDNAKRLLEEQTARYQEGVERVAAYLSNRGITKEAAHIHRLGYVGSDNPADTEYAGRISIPYITVTSVVDLRFRAVDDVKPKYLSRAGAKTRLYNVTDLMKESTTLYVCEGEIDTITVSTLCGLPSVGVPGANNWQNHFKLLMQDYAKIVVLCDGDEAGRQFGKTICKEVDNAIAISMPDGMDVNDLYVSGGREAVLRQVGYE
jgi:DNA primase